MSALSYSCRLLTNGAKNFSTEQALTVTDQPYSGGMHLAEFSIFNRPGSGRVVTLEGVEFDGYNRMASNNQHGMYRFNSTTWTQAPKNPDAVTIKALGQATTSLSANVDCGSGNGQMGGTPTGLSYFYHHPQLRTADIGPLFGRSFGKTSGAGGCEGRKSAVMYHDSAATQAYIIREGESFIITFGSAPTAARVNVIFRHAGVVYEMSTVARGDKAHLNVAGGDLDEVYIRNLTGSGSNVEILSVDVIDELAGMPTPVITAHLELIDEHSGGDAIVPVALDSANGSLPSGIELRTGALTLRGGSKKGGWITRPYLQRTTAISQGLFRDLTWAPVGLSRHLRKKCNGRVVLREGEGAALLYRLPSAAAVGEWLVNFTLALDDGVYPAVGDVAFGTNYGPTGTEYTGTLSGGGGGGSYIRRR